MSEIIVTVLIIVVLIVLKLIFGFSTKDVKKLVQNADLDDLTNRLPDNVEICKSILKLINNENVLVKESANEKSGTSLYIVTTNSIIIAKIKDRYTRVQTIAHECIHSIQDKKLLIFNFVFSNIYLLYFLVSIVLTILGIFNNTMLYVCILTILGVVHYTVRSILEIDAMTRARYLSEEYLKSTGLYKREEIDMIISEYDKLNIVGIKATEYMLLFNIFVKIVIYIGIAFYL